MPTALTYTSYVAEMQVLTQFNNNDPAFIQNLPSAISYAEDRINRELDLLSAVASNSSLALTAGTRTLDISAANINVLERLNIITPFSQTNPELGTRNPCVPVTEDYLDLVYGSAATQGLPTNFIRQTDKIVLFGPFPDQNYTVELVGTVWQLPLSSSNPTTWIATYIPDLMIAASMIFMTGFMKNFGAQSDDPRSAQSWESQYDLLMKSAATEDARRKFKSAGWTADIPNPLNQPRT